MASQASPAETDEHPEELPGQEPDSPYGKDNVKLPEQLQRALKTCIERMNEQDRFLRRREVLKDRRNRWYERGYQHIYENWRNGLFTLASPGGTGLNGFGMEVQTPNYIGDFNIFRPYMRVIQSVLTQNPPGINFQPSNPKLTEDVQAAEVAENYRQMFDRSNDDLGIRKQIVRMFEVSGRTVIWTRTEANGQKFGFNDDGSPKSMETATVHGTLESKVPILSKCQEDCGFIALFDDPDVLDAKAMYPEFKDKIKAGAAGIGESTYERLARIGVLQGNSMQGYSGESFTHVVTRTNAWFRPSRFGYEGFDEEFSDEGMEATTIREALEELFPLGVHCVFVGSQYVGSWAECMDDAITIGFPYEGDGMFRSAIMDDAVIAQDTFNDLMNWCRENFDTGGPETWIDAEDIDYDAILDQRADPNAIRQFKLKTGQKMGDALLRTAGPDVPDSFREFIEDVRDTLLQFMLASPPVIQGGAMPDQKTSSGIAQLASHAMGQQAIWFGAIQRMCAKMYYQAALCASRNPDHSEEIVIPGKSGQEVSINLQRITKGKFGAYPDEDSSFPETTQQKRQTLQGLVTLAAQSPPFLQALLESPDNWGQINKLMGLPELTVIQDLARQKQMFEIQELLQGAPIPPSIEEIQAAGQQALVQHAAATVTAKATGQPEPPAPAPPNPQSMLKPSIMVELLDYHQYEFEKCKEWLSSPDRRSFEADPQNVDPATGKCPGVENLKLHAIMHQKFMMLLAPPPMAAPPPPAAHKPPGHAVAPGAPPRTTPAPAGPPAPAAG